MVGAGCWRHPSVPGLVRMSHVSAESGASAVVGPAQSASGANVEPAAGVALAEPCLPVLEWVPLQADPLD